jgi:hypothetical protein
LCSMYSTWCIFSSRFQIFFILQFGLLLLDKQETFTNDKSITKTDMTMMNNLKLKMGETSEENIWKECT